MKQIPFVDFPKGQVAGSPLPDGVYATISHNPGFHGRYALVPNVFPWRANVYEFKDGNAYDRASGSDAGYVLRHWSVAKVYLIGLDASERTELNKKLAGNKIELVPDPAAEAEDRRARDSLGPSFHLPV